jgi:Ser/Thr protein kinase RdoA (MazF antagonist)
VIANPGMNGRPIVSGVIDFGDVTESYIIGDLSIAIVPLFIMEDKPILQQTLVINDNNVLDLF